MTMTENELHQAWAKLSVLQQENILLKHVLKEAGNELCYQCGRYKDEHLGACDYCKWRKVKSGEMPL